MAINLLEKAYKQVYDYLAKEGQKIVNEASWSAEVKQRSGNMHDAFGYAVFHNGRKVKFGYASGGEQATKPHKGWKKHDIPAMYGRNYVDEFFEKYPYEHPSNGIVLVCVNAVFYAQILEDGAQARPHRDIATRYRIISQVSSEMRDLQSSFKGSKVELISPVGKFHGLS